jgi:hypothetical protein
LRGLSKPALCELLEPFIVLGPRSRKNTLDMRAQARLAPVVPGRFLGCAGVTLARSLENRARSSRVECRVGSRRKNESPTRGAASRILVHERSRHRASKVQRLVPHAARITQASVTPLTPLGETASEKYVAAERM